MRRPAPILHFSLIVSAFAVVASACHRSSPATIETERTARTADSIRTAEAARNRSSATQAVTFDENERTRYTRVEQMIQARFTGVTVTPSASGFTIRIRGAASLTLSNEPLILIDGVSRASADLRGIDPRVVERIEIVKDGAASFYGSRGANGVVIITTIRGR